jgi:hypothetical protein
VKKTALIAIGALLMLAGLTACSSANAFPSQCAYVIGDGAGDSHQIKQIIRPGGRVDDKGDDLVEFVPCNARNFLITDQEKTGDRQSPALGRTAASGKEPALPVKAYLRSYFTLNQSDDALRAFLPFCEKYGCYETDPDKVTGGSNYSTDGWNGMLRENYSLVIDKVFRDAVADFPPTVWQTQGEWPKIAEKMSASFAKEMQKATGSTENFFCGTWNKDQDRTENCTPVRFEIDSIRPEDERVESIQQQTALAEQEKALNDAKAKATATRYGPLSNYFNGLQDTIAACKEAGQSCTIVIGGSNIQVTPNGAR